MSKKILIVDDDSDIIETLENRLRSLNYDVVTAKDGQEAITKAYSDKPDLILLDLMLPKIDGHMVCGLLKGDKRSKDIPIMIITARAGDEDRDLSEELGAGAYLNKPFTSEALTYKIKELIGD